MQNITVLHEPAAFVIDKALAAYINSMFREADTPDPKTLDPDEFEDAFGDIKAACDKLSGLGIAGVVWLPIYSGKVQPVFESEPSAGEDYDAKEIGYIPADITASLFSAAYKTSDELIGEFRRKLNAVFPEDFPFEVHLSELLGLFVNAE